MKIDIDKLIKAELIDVNNRSVERLRFLACRSLSAQTGLRMISVRLPADASTGWNGIIVPARTPRSVVAKLNADIVTAVHSGEVQKYLASLTVETRTTTPNNSTLSSARTSPVGQTS